MCGRATLVTPGDELAELFALDEVPELEARYNIAPSQTIAILRVDPQRPGRRIELVKWGLVPSFAPDPSIGHRMINARVESIFTRSAFRDAARERRCLVVVDGFYEWQPRGKTKQPFHVRRRDGRPFALAGLWEAWHGNVSATILTEPSQAAVASIHDRMPVILAPRDWARWLDPSVSTAEEVRALARGDAGDLVATPVSTLVNNANVEGPACLAPAEQGDLLLR